MFSKMTASVGRFGLPRVASPTVATSAATFSAVTFAVALLGAGSAFADIVVKDPYARSSGMKAKAGAAFMILHNDGEEDDRLVAASADVAKRVELHTHIADENGVMKMREVEGGIDVPAGGMTVLKRGGLHVMFMGLTAPMEQGAVFPLTLSFEKAGDIVVEVPVDLARKPMAGMMKHGDMKQGDMKHGDMNAGQKTAD